MWIPPELIEKILWYADYKTLRSAIRVNTEWRDIVYHLAKKRCLRDITERELLEYNTKLYGKCHSPQDWAELYDNWSSWQDIDLSTQVSYKTAEYLQNQNLFISYITTCGNYVAVGYINGIVEVYHINGSFVKIFKTHEDEDIVRIHLVPDDTNSDEPSSIALICDDIITVKDFDQQFITSVTPVSYQHKSISSYKSRISLITVDFILLILKISKNKETKCMHCETEDGFFLGNNIPRSVIATALGEGTCSVVVYRTFQTIYLDEKFIKEIRVNPSLGKAKITRSYTWILQDKVLINSYYSSVPKQTEDILAMYFLDEYNTRYTSGVKIFKLQQSLKALVHVIIMHGSTLVFGCSDGSVLFYRVKNWRYFDIRYYAKRCQLPAEFGAVRSIDVIGKGVERTYYVSGESGVYKITCSTKSLKC